MPVNADLDWALEDVRRRLPAYSLFRQYDEGEHRLLFASAKYRDTFGDLFREFANNLCDDVVNGITDRLQPQGWSSEDKGLNALADLVWTRNMGESRYGAVHRNGFREGDGFTIVQADAQNRARIYRQRPTQMAVRYSTDAPDEKALAAKVYRAGKRYLVNLYYPDRTERYGSRGVGADGGMPKAAAFTLLAVGDPSLGQSQPITPHDDGMPVYHYPNGELSEYGRSILVGVIPLQDALNKAVADMLVTMEGHAAPVRWARGIEVERDPVTGRERDPFAKARTPGSVMRTASKEAQFGQFDQASMEGFLAVQDQFKIDAARKGYLPPWAINLRSGGTQFPSGVALLVAEGRTNKLARDRQRDWGTEHRAEMAHALRLELGSRDVSADDVTLGWEPPETGDEKALIETLLMKKELGVPLDRLLTEAGYSQDEVDDFMLADQERERSEREMMDVLQGGRAGVTPAAAGALAGLPGSPIPLPGPPAT